MELMRSNAIKVWGVVFGLLFLASCSSKETEKEKKSSKTEQEPEIPLNSLLVDDIEFTTEYTEAKSLGEQRITTPFGAVRRMEALVFDAEDSLTVWVSEYDSLPEVPLLDLISGEVYTRFGEETPFDIDSSNVEMIRTHFGDSLFWEYRKAYNLTVLIESKKVLEKRIDVGVVRPPKDLGDVEN